MIVSEKHPNDENDIGLGMSKMTLLLLCVLQTEAYNGEVDLASKK